LLTRRLGGDQVGCVGFGGAPIALRPDRPPDDEAVTVIHAALDAGVTLFDTADVYTPAGTGRGHGERLLARALRERDVRFGAGDHQVVVTTKGGKYWDRDGEVQIDARPAALKAACERSLEALGVETITLYQLHEVDPSVPVEESVGALVELSRAGKIDQIGLCNVTVDDLERARAVGSVVSVQNRYSPALSMTDPVLERCEALGIAFLPWGPLTGFRGLPGEAGTTVAARFADLAERLGVSVPRLVLAWELARSPVMIPIPGSTRIATVCDSAAAADLKLSAAEMAWLSAHPGDGAVAP
jgi:aryl-alcohol dehydrogenase-like predicted oxidoreductase